MDDIVSIKICDIKDFEAPPGRGVVVMNPPYGERMVKDNIEELYKSIGDSFKKNFFCSDLIICPVPHRKCGGLKEMTVWSLTT